MIPVRLHLSPIRLDAGLAVVRDGDRLLVDGLALDLAALPEPDPEAEPASPWLAGPLRREGGVVVVPLLLPHGPAAPAGTLFPAPVAADADGPVALPPWG